MFWFDKPQQVRNVLLSGAWLKMLLLTILYISSVNRRLLSSITSRALKTVTDWNSRELPLAICDNVPVDQAFDKPADLIHLLVMLVGWGFEWLRRLELLRLFVRLRLSVLYMSDTILGRSANNMIGQSKPCTFDLLGWSMTFLNAFSS